MKSSMWIRLRELPMEFYGHTIIAEVGEKLGRLVKTVENSRRKVQFGKPFVSPNR